MVHQNMSYWVSLGILLLLKGKKKRGGGLQLGEETLNK